MLLPNLLYYMIMRQNTCITMIIDYYLKIKNTNMEMLTRRE